MLSSIISNRLTEYAEKKFLVITKMDSEKINNIHTLRQITEKEYEHNTQIVTLFIDFRQAFHSIYRRKMIKILQQVIPSKLLRLIIIIIIIIRMTLEDSQAKEQHDRNFKC